MGRARAGADADADFLFLSLSICRAHIRTQQSRGTRGAADLSLSPLALPVTLESPDAGGSHHSLPRHHLPDSLICFCGRLPPPFVFCLCFSLSRPPVLSLSLSLFRLSAYPRCQCASAINSKPVCDTSRSCFPGTGKSLTASHFVTYAQRQTPPPSLACCAVIPLSLPRLLTQEHRERERERKYISSR